MSPSLSPDPAPPGLSSQRICCIVITYHPDDTAYACLRNTLAHAAHTVVIDNASPPECRARLHELIRGAPATLVEHPVNAGVAAGLNLGIRTAVSLGYDWFLLLDQDTLLFASTITDLINAHQQCQAEIGDRIALIGSNYFQQCADGSVREARVRFAGGRLWHEEELAITAGTLLSRRVFDSVGSFREDFFIDHVDHEYCLRARRHGLVVVQTAYPIMAHRIGLAQKRRVWLKLGAKSALSGYSPLRRYYQCRNLIVLAREYGRDFPAIIDVLRRHSFRESKRSLLYEGRFFAHARALLGAIRHGRQGALGPHRP